MKYSRDYKQKYNNFMLQLKRGVRERENNFLTFSPLSLATRAQLLKQVYNTSQAFQSTGRLIQRNIKSTQLTVIKIKGQDVGGV